MNENEKKLNENLKKCLKLSHIHETNCEQDCRIGEAFIHCVGYERMKLGLEPRNYLKPKKQKQGFIMQKILWSLVAAGILGGAVYLSQKPQNAYVVEDNASFKTCRFYANKAAHLGLLGAVESLKLKTLYGLESLVDENSDKYLSCRELEKAINRYQIIYGQKLIREREQKK